MHKKRAGELRSRDAASAVDLLQAPEEDRGQLQAKAGQRSLHRTGAGNPAGGFRRALRRRGAGQSAGPALASPLGWASSGWDGTRCGRAPPALTAGQAFPATPIDLCSSTTRGCSR